MQFGSETSLWPRRCGQGGRGALCSGKWQQRVRQEGFLFLRADGEGGPSDGPRVSSWFYLMESCTKVFVGPTLIRRHQLLSSQVLEEAPGHCPSVSPTSLCKVPYNMQRFILLLFEIVKSIDIFSYDFLHCFCTCYCHNNNDDGLFIACHLFNAFLTFLIVFFLLFYFSHRTYLGFIEEYGTT